MSAGQSPARSATDVVVAGLDLLSGQERHADAVALAAAEALRAAGGTDVTVTTRVAGAEGDRHVALVLEAAGLDGAATADVLGAVVADGHGDRWGLLVGSTYRGAPELRPDVERLLADHAAAADGRAVVFPGSADLPAALTVAELLAATAVQQVRVLGGAEPDPATTLVTRGFVRPRWVEGALVLHAQPAAGGTLVPFEVADPTPCCAFHG